MTQNNTETKTPKTAIAQKFDSVISMWEDPDMDMEGLHTLKTLKEEVLEIVSQFVPSPTKEQTKELDTIVDEKYPILSKVEWGNLIKINQTYDQYVHKTERVREFFSEGFLAGKKAQGRETEIESNTSEIPNSSVKKPSDEIMKRLNKIHQEREDILKEYAHSKDEEEKTIMAIRMGEMLFRIKDLQWFRDTFPLSDKPEKIAKQGDEIEWSFAKDDAAKHLAGKTFRAKVAIVCEKERNYGVYAEYGQDYIGFDKAKIIKVENVEIKTPEEMIAPYIFKSAGKVNIKDAIKVAYSYHAQFPQQEREVDWESFRLKFFKECIIKYSGVLDYDLAPEPLFDWFRTHLHKYTINK